MTSPFEEERACWDGFDIIPRSKGGYYINSLTSNDRPSWGRSEVPGAGDVGQFQHETQVGLTSNGKSVAQDGDEEDEDMGDEDDEDMEEEEEVEEVEDMVDGDDEDMNRSKGADVPNPSEEELVCASFFQSHGLPSYSWHRTP